MSTGNYIPKDEYERACRERYDFAQSVMGRAMNITDKELERKDILQKVKCIISKGYIGKDQITLIKTIWILTKEVADLRKEIKELKQQLSK